MSRYTIMSKYTIVCNVALLLALGFLPMPVAGESSVVAPVEDPALVPEEVAAEQADGKEVSWSQLTDREKARYYFEQKRYRLAERAYIEIVERSGDSEALGDVLVELAECYYAGGNYLKAIEIMEQAFLRFPNIGRDAEQIFRLGQFYKAGGLREQAVDLFYQVINSIVVSGPKVLDKYLPIARMAQFEIARTNYENREYRKAYEAFDRLDVLDLSPENHETIFYYKVLAALKAAKPDVGQDLIESFLEKFPQSEYLPEMMYLRAEVLMRQGKVEAATAQLLDLLDNFPTDSPFDSGELIFWKQQAGNRLANRFYNEKDYAKALRIYQGLVGLNESSEWQLPVIYQISLCFEKLKMYERAKESYTFLLEELERMAASERSRSLEKLKESAAWRLNVVEWKSKTESEAAALLIR